MTRIKFHKFPFLLALTAAAFYWTFGYDLLRADLWRLLMLYGALFFITWKFLQLEKNPKILLLSAVIFRLVFLVSLPALSPDFYRFIWDGSLLLQGNNPLLATPSEWMARLPEIPPLLAESYTGMTSLSRENPSSYPPLKQVLFAGSVALGGGTVLGTIVATRMLLLFADLGTWFFGSRLLRHFHLPSERIYWYLLNPLIIIELTGNLHFEGLMVFFLSAALWLLTRNKVIPSSLVFSLSVLIKLLPLLLLPALFRFLRPRKAVVFYAINVAVVFLAFLPFLSWDSLWNYGASLRLWFQDFEFNASLWYIIRWIGFQMEGYNTLVYVGPVMAMTAAVVILGIGLIRKNATLKEVMTSMLFSLSVYFFLSSTVHPWYLCTLVFLSIFTRYRFPIVWSLMVFLSYGAYSRAGHEENLWLIAAEYLVVFLVLISEMRIGPRDLIFRSKSLSG